MTIRTDKEAWRLSQKFWERFNAYYERHYGLPLLRKVRDARSQASTLEGPSHD